MTEDKAHVLIVEDREIHQKGAELLSKEGYQVDIVSDFRKGLECLGGDGPRHLFPEKPVKPYMFVLTDLFIPYDSTHRRPDHWEPTALGFSFALNAARQSIPYIGIITDQNHHDGPIPHSLDLFYIDYTRNSSGRYCFDVNGSKLMLFDERDGSGLVIARASSQILREITTDGDISYEDAISGVKTDLTYGDLVSNEKGAVGIKDWMGAINALKGD